MGPSKSWGKFVTVSGETLKIQIFLIGGKFKKWSNVLTSEAEAIFINRGQYFTMKILYDLRKFITKLQK